MTRWKRPSFAAAGTIAVLALAGCAVSGAHAYSAQATPSATPLPRATALASPTETAQAAAGGATTVVTIGDSIMAGYGLDRGDDWPTLMAAADQVPITNLGCSGGGFIAVGLCGTDFAGLISAAVARDPGVVIIEGSDNDEGESTAAIDAATTRTVQALRAALPHALIVGLSTLWDQPTPAPAEIAASSAAVQSAVTATGGVYLDIGQPLQGQSALLQWDDEHPTVAGQQVLLQTVSQALASAGISL